MSRTAATILVRPFRSLSDDIEHAYFARGCLDDLFTELSYFSALDLRAEGMAEKRARPIGTVIRTSAVRALAEEAGYATFEILPIENEQFRFYRLGA